MRNLLALGTGALLVAAATAAAQDQEPEQLGFELPVLSAMAEQAQHAQYVDLDGDGTRDIVAAGWSTGRVQILRGQAGGTFAAPEALWARTPALCIGAADLNADGVLDIVVGLEQGTRVRYSAQFQRATAEEGATYFLSNEQGGYDTMNLTVSGRQLHATGFADVNDDGLLDVVFATLDGASALVSDAEGRLSDHGFLSTEHFGGSAGTPGLAIGDFDDDGDDDVAVFNTILWNEDDGTFSSGPAIFDVVQRWLTAGDLDGDGVAELIGYTLDSTTNLTNVHVARNDGAGAFTELPPFVTGYIPAAQLHVSDVNGDGNADLVAPGGSAHISLGRGDGTVGAPQVVPYSRADELGLSYWVAVDDVDDDGAADLVFLDVYGPAAGVRFAVAGEPPTVSAVSPPAAIVGVTTQVTVTGTGFLEGAAVRYTPGRGIFVRDTQRVSATELTFALEVYDTPVTELGPTELWIVNADARQAVAWISLELGQPPVPTSVAPGAVPAASSTDVVILGTDFDGEVQVDFGPDILLNRLERDSDRRLTANITIAPVAATGPREILLTNGSGGDDTTPGGSFVIERPRALELIQQVGKLRIRERAERDRLRVVGALRFNEYSDDSFDPAAEGLTLLIGDPAAPFEFSIPANDPRWRMRGDKSMWKTPRGQRPSVQVLIDSGSHRFKLVVRRTDISTPDDGIMLVDVTAGPDRGTTTTAWRATPTGLRLR